MGKVQSLLLLLVAGGWVLCLSGVAAAANSVERLQQQNVLRHLGVPYANFVTGSGDGLDVELMKRFAAHLGVEYEYVKTDWSHVLSDLLGRDIEKQGQKHVLGAARPQRGDVVANGLTRLKWRQRFVAFSRPVFTTQVWLLAPGEATITPITPSGSLEQDIQQVKQRLAGHTVLTRADTCLDARLYKLAASGAKVIDFQHSLNDMAPAVILGRADATILDVPDALVALQKWAGHIKVIGPVSPPQTMGVAFRPEDKALRQRFNRFFRQLCTSGAYKRLVQKYYPAVLRYYPHFFDRLGDQCP